jgi:hypothetical protein
MDVGFVGRSCIRGRPATDRANLWPAAWLVHCRQRIFEDVVGIVQWASAAIQDVLGSGVERDICPCRVRDVQFQVEAGA